MEEYLMVLVFLLEVAASKFYWTECSPKNKQHRMVGATPPTVFWKGYIYSINHQINEILIFQNILAKIPVFFNTMWY